MNTKSTHLLIMINQTHSHCKWFFPINDYVDSGISFGSILDNIHLFLIETLLGESFHKVCNCQFLNCFAVRSYKLFAKLYPVRLFGFIEHEFICFSN